MEQDVFGLIDQLEKLMMEFKKTTCQNGCEYCVFNKVLLASVDSIGHEEDWKICEIIRHLL